MYDLDELMRMPLSTNQSAWVIKRLNELGVTVNCGCGGVREVAPDVIDLPCRGCKILPVTVIVCGRCGHLEFRSLARLGELPAFEPSNKYEADHLSAVSLFGKLTGGSI